LPDAPKFSVFENKEFEELGESVIEGLRKAGLSIE
jgi:hypothetical protein